MDKSFSINVTKIDAALEQRNIIHQEVTASWIYPRCAIAQNCMRPTLGSEF